MEKRFILVFLLCLFCSSCGMTVHPEPKLPQPIFESYPLTVVLYLNPEFKKYEATNGVEFGWTIVLGQASGEMIAQTLKAMFIRVITVDKIADIPQKFSATIEPGIRAFTFNAEQGTVEIAYTFNIFDNQKQLIDTISVYGNGRFQQKLDFLKNTAERAMQDAMAQLMVKFQNDPEIQTWLKANIETRTLKELKQ